MAVKCQFHICLRFCKLQRTKSQICQKKINSASRLYLRWEDISAALKEKNAMGALKQTWSKKRATLTIPYLDMNAWHGTKYRAPAKSRPDIRNITLTSIWHRSNDIHLELQIWGQPRHFSIDRFCQYITFWYLTSICMSDVTY